MAFQSAYPKDVEKKMRNVFASMTEKDRRRYAGMEATKLGHGGISYLCKVFQCSKELIQRGMREVDDLPNDPTGDRIRVPGGGRKKYEAQNPDVVSQVEDVLQHRTAGDPMRDDIKFTDQTPTEISRAVKPKRGHDIAIDRSPDSKNTWLRSEKN